ncbi:DUF6232 family protein [Streptomyces sp. NPDC015492]|uniref:DUF6232 family protein n=1 Tax=Streptomyces sp. NPDC015492 TaxID=3364958 RepID=UPI0036F548C0
MTVTGDPGPPPPRPPSDPPTGPPVGPPSGAPSDPPEPPPVPPPGAGWGGVLQLRVSRRMLWVGAAALPLHNITRVEAFRLTPDRGAALLRFLKWLAVALVIYAVLNGVSDGDAAVGEFGPLLFVVLIALAVYLGRELFAAAKPVLLVEMSSGSAVVVTLPSMEELREIAGLIAHAIDNPAAEFSRTVQQFNTTNNNYGTVINMNGGRNNRGISL